jgi:RNA recognition motif-containing protein
MEIKLCVANISDETSVEDLSALFAQAGTVASVELIIDRDTGVSKGCAFVGMINEVEALKAVSLFSGYEMNSRMLAVNLSQSPEETGVHLSNPSVVRTVKRGPAKPRLDQTGGRSKLSVFRKSGGPVGPRRRSGSQHY